MLSRLASALQELSGEEGLGEPGMPGGEPPGMLEPQLPTGEGDRAPEDQLERLDHLEQQVVQLKELVKEKDDQLKNEREAAEARFTKLKLQAKAKMASLSKQLANLKGQDGATSPDSSFTEGSTSLEEELRELRSRLSQQEAHGQHLQGRLLASEHLLQERERAHAEQVKLLQAVVCEKDVRFQEQIQSHEEELLKLSAQLHSASAAQEALQASQQRWEQLQEAVTARTQELDLLQQEVLNADQQKQILTAQFRQMEEDLTEASRREEEQRGEVSRLESLLSTAKEGERTYREAVESERAAMEEQTRELALLQDQQEKVCRGLQALSLDPPLQDPISQNPSELLGALQAWQARLQGDLDHKEQRCTQLSQQVATLQGQLEQSSAEAATTILHLQQEIHQMSADPADPSERGSLERDAGQLPQDQTSTARPGDHTPPEQVDAEVDAAGGSPRGLDGAPEDETTLVGEEEHEVSVLSVSADNGSSPELVGPQSESPAGSRGVSSDEMVTSCDSEVAHSSWTLLEAVAQDGAPEWPQGPQDQSWVEASLQRQDSSTQSSSSVVINIETAELSVAPETLSSHCDVDPASDRAFAQALAEELERRYSEMLAELQELREASAGSRKELRNLEEDRRLLAAAKEEAESRVSSALEELRSAKEQLESLSRHHSSLAEERRVEVRHLEEQIGSWNAESDAKDREIQALQAELKEAQEAFADQEAQVRMLSVQLEDRVLLSSQLEQKLQDLENSLLEYSQTTDLSNASLSEKDSEITELQQRLTQKEREMMELSDSVSSKLLEAGEEKSLISSEVKKLREQIAELENAREEKRNVNEGSPSAGVEDDEASVLRKEKQELETQMANMKKKLQVALVQRKELMKRVAELEEEAKTQTDEDSPAAAETPSCAPDAGPEAGPEARPERQEMAAELEEVRQTLRRKEEEVEALEERIAEQDGALAKALALSQTLREEAERPEQAASSAELLSRVSTLEAECDALQRKLLEAQDSRKDTIRKAKDKDRHHREQMRQQKEEYSELLERVEQQSAEREDLLITLRELEAQQRDVVHQEPQETPAAEGWVQEGWVDFADAAQPKEPVHLSGAEAVQMQTLREELRAAQEARREMEEKLQEATDSLSLKHTDLLELSRELEVLREKEAQVDVLSEELDALSQKCLQLETSSELLKAEVESAASAGHEASVAAMQAEVEEFKHFLHNKNQEISELSRQLGDQKELLHGVQDVVSEKDRLIASLQEGLQAEQEQRQRLEAELPARQEEERDGEAKAQQLQRKLQAALISRKDVLKENKTQKEELARLRRDAEVKDGELVRLIAEVDRALQENESLGSTCESLKLAMEGVVSEKDACRREVEAAARARGEWEERARGMREEYETLLRSYENVSDEAERVRRVLEAARQERQELAARTRAHEAGRAQAERRAEEAQRELDGIKDKMRKFAKTKQQKITELEEEIERLRDAEERTGADREVRRRPAEADGLREQLQELQAEVEAAAAQRDSLGQQLEEMREQLAREREEQSVTAATVPAGSVAQTCIAVTREEEKKETVERQPEDEDEPEVTGQSPAGDTPSQVAEQQNPEPGLNDNGETSLEEEAVSTERGRRREREPELEDAVASLEQQLWESREKEQGLQDLVVSLQQNLQSSQERERGLAVEASHRDLQFQEERRSLEAEKDDLEERLMNQLARLNGSIAGYQQEAADTRERLAGLQRHAEQLQRERAEMEARAQSEAERAARLEEERRQERRERAEAEAEAGRRRELEQQLQAARRDADGGRGRAQQLEELLRDKQQELRRLQSDGAKRQESLGRLGGETEALRRDRDELQRQRDRTRLEATGALERLGRAEVELEACRRQLEEAQGRAGQALEEKAVGEREARRREAALREEAAQTLDDVRFRLGAELKQAELRLEEAYREQEREEEAVQEARRAVEEAEGRAQLMQARLDESLARLAAFSRCMCSLQDDRDRVLDEARQWEERFHSTLKGKEAEVREAEARAKELAERMQRETTQREELQMTADGLQRAEKELRRRLVEEVRRAEEARAALEGEARVLQEALAQLGEARADAAALRVEAEGLRSRAGPLEEEARGLREEVQQAAEEHRAAAEEQAMLGLRLERLEEDLRSSRELVLDLQGALQEKESRELQLLQEKEQAVTQAAEAARQEADGRAREAQEQLQRRGEQLEEQGERLRAAQQEAGQSSARLDAFMKAMRSLQDDRDRVLADYTQLEERHLQVMLEKDGVIQEAAAESNGLKERLRSLLVQRDDLFAERAKLAAQLHGYREELGQVLALKEAQHRHLLAAQRQRVAQLEARLGRRQVDQETPQKAGDPGKQVEAIDTPGAEVEKLREQVESLKKALQEAQGRAEGLEAELKEAQGRAEGLEAELKEAQGRAKGLEAELKEAQGRAEGLEAELMEAQGRAEGLEAELKEAQGRAEGLEAELKEAQGRAEGLEAELEREHAEQRWEGGVARAESESAQERVAELARDLLQLQHRLQEVQGEKQELQDRLQKEKQEVRGGRGAPATQGEVWSLKNALQALQNDRERLLEQMQQLGGGKEPLHLAQQLEEERGRARLLEEQVGAGQQEVQALRVENSEWCSQAEHHHQLHQEALSALAERDQLHQEALSALAERDQLHQEALSALTERDQLHQEALSALAERDQQMLQLRAQLEAPQTALLQAPLHSKGTEVVDSAPGGPQERCSPVKRHDSLAEVKELQQRLEEEVQCRMSLAEQLSAAQERLQRHARGEWHPAHGEAAVLIEPPEGTLTRTRRGGPGLMRVLRVAFCSRQKTPLLLTLYLLTVHAVLLLCLGGYI